MELYSTQHQVANVGLEEAIFKGLPDDNGLFMPTAIPKLPKVFFEKLPEMSLSEIAYQVSECLLKGEIPEVVLKEIAEEAINFDAPVVQVSGNIFVQELFHGPTLAFKDFGARFMSRLMSYYLKNKQEKITILVATSGDTGSAVAQGFLGVPNIEVIILYPSGKVSDIQEKQLTTAGQNITALEIDGNFDDCQRLVKQAFLDASLNQQLKLTSANSINISRLIPQSFYYFYAYAQLRKLNDLPLVVSVPSGNFGNLCGGLIAHKMGLPIHKFIAATNVNDIVPKYLQTGEFTPRPSVKTIANAMDVGNPSNFPRLLALFDADFAAITHEVDGQSFGDDAIKAAIESVFQDTGYVLDPHGAIGFLALEVYFKKQAERANGVFLATAHPAKFPETVTEATGTAPQIPERLKAIINRKKIAIRLGSDFEGFKAWLQSR